MNAPVFLAAEDFDALGSTPQRSALPLAMQGRAYVGVGIATAVLAGLTSIEIGVEVSYDQTQWLRVHKPDDTSEPLNIVLDADVNNVSPADSEVGAYMTLWVGTTSGAPMPVGAPFARLVVTGTGSPDPSTNSLLRATLVAFG
jgi:hypothetical protein